MPGEKTNYEILQECSQKISSLIELEKQHRAKMVCIEGEELEFPEELVDNFRRKFQTIKVEVIVTLNQIHL